MPLSPLGGKDEGRARWRELFHARVSRHAPRCIRAPLGSGPSFYGFVVLPRRQTCSVRGLATAPYRFVGALGFRPVLTERPELPPPA